MSVVLPLWLSMAWLSATQVQPPLSPAAMPSSEGLTVDMPRQVRAPLLLRMSVFGTPLVKKQGDFVANSLSLEASLASNLWLGVAAVSRSLWGSSGTRAPNDVGARMRYDLISGYDWHVAAYGGAIVSAETHGLRPREPAYDLSFDLSVARRLGPARLGAELGIQSPQFGAGQNKTTVDAGLAARWEISSGIELIGEGLGRMSADKDAKLQALVSGGISVPIMSSLRLHASGMARQDGGRWFPGALVAISGQVTFGDLDSDQVPDVEDACPNQAGSSEYLGCVFVDEDGDHVWDQLDACIGRQGPAKNAGCPVRPDQASFFKDSKN